MQLNDMKLKTVLIACSAFLLGYYSATEYAKEPTKEQQRAFATAGLWQRQEFLRRLLEDARKKTQLPVFTLKTDQNLPK